MIYTEAKLKNMKENELNILEEGGYNDVLVEF